jgi:hypothetical protein
MGRLKKGVLLFFEKQVPVLFDYGSPAARFIPMKKSGCPLLSGLDNILRCNKLGLFARS